MLTSVKVQFGAYLVDWRGNLPTCRTAHSSRGGGLQSDKRDEAGCRKATPWPSSVFQLRRYTGLAVASTFTVAERSVVKSVQAHRTSP